MLPQQDKVLVALGLAASGWLPHREGVQPCPRQHTLFLERSKAELRVTAGLAPPPALTDREAAGLFLGDSAVLQQQGSDGLRADGVDGRATQVPQPPAQGPPPRHPTSASSVRK